jgi:hypothetical protein
MGEILQIPLPVIQIIAAVRSSGFFRGNQGKSNGPESQARSRPVP